MDIGRHIERLLEQTASEGFHSLADPLAGICFLMDRSPIEMLCANPGKRMAFIRDEARAVQQAGIMEFIFFIDLLQWRRAKEALVRV